MFSAWSLNSAPLNGLADTTAVASSERALVIAQDTFDSGPMALGRALSSDTSTVTWAGIYPNPGSAEITGGYARTSASNSGSLTIEFEWPTGAPTTFDVVVVARGPAVAPTQEQYLELSVAGVDSADGSAVTAYATAYALAFGGGAYDYGIWVDGANIPINTWNSQALPAALSYASGDQTFVFSFSPGQITCSMNGVSPVTGTYDPANTIVPRWLGLGLWKMEISSITVTGGLISATAPRFGTPRSSQASPAASLGIVAAFGTPSSPYPRSLTASGWTELNLGRPVAGTFQPQIINRTLSASTLLPVTFGQAITLTAVTLSASGASATSFGTGRCALGLSAAGNVATAFGSPLASSGARTAGSQTTLFGAPTTGHTLAATPVFRATRWGIPLIVRSNTFLSTGAVPTTRLGQPTASRINARQAGGSVSTMLGAPSCALRYRALHTPPACRFGNPLLIRNPSC